MSAIKTFQIFYANSLKLSIICCNFKFKTVYILVYVSKNYQRKPCIRYLHQNYLNTFLNLFDFQITNHINKLNYSFVCTLLRIIYILHITFFWSSGFIHQRIQNLIEISFSLYQTIGVRLFIV